MLALARIERQLHFANVSSTLLGCKVMKKKQKKKHPHAVAITSTPFPGLPLYQIKENECAS